MTEQNTDRLEVSDVDWGAERSGKKCVNKDDTQGEMEVVGKDDHRTLPR